MNERIFDIKKVARYIASVSYTHLERRESANSRNRRNPYLKVSYPNGVTLILPADISIEQLRAYISITV